MRLPDFLGVGTQKGGTTTLHNLLSQDSRIGLPRCKEVHYFDKEPLPHIQWYADHFKPLNNKLKIGEITPYYMFYPGAAERISKTLPGAKIIILLRDPVDRTVSQYFHAKRNGYETLELVDAIKAEEERLSSGSRYSHQKHSYISRSRYHEQIKEFRSFHKDKNILIIKSEDMFSSIETVWPRIEVFLGLSDMGFTPTLLRSNKGKGEATDVSDFTKEQIRKMLENTYTEMEEQYGICWN